MIFRRSRTLPAMLLAFQVGALALGLVYVLTTTETAAAFRIAFDGLTSISHAFEKAITVIKNTHEAGDTK